jgi:hypothetical protein
MSVDFQQVRQQVQAMGENALRRLQELGELRQYAAHVLQANANQHEYLYDKINQAAQADPNLRSARPATVFRDRPAESLDGSFPLPGLPDTAVVIAADGSQIAPDRHAAVNYCLINVGAIQLEMGSPAAPQISITSQLFYDEDLYTASGLITDARLALMRDLNERQRLAELARQATAPVITFTDGPMELWLSRESVDDSASREGLNAYLEALRQLEQLNVATAGYVDKPAATLAVRLLEVAMADTEQLSEIRRYTPLRGVTDKDLFRGLLPPGARSAVFAMQSPAAARYTDGLALHFFYLNVGRPERPWLARVDIPGWVAHNRAMLDTLHATLVDQCRALGNRPYPYLLHRAHEAAVVSLDEKNQVTQMILLELARRGVEPGETSYKQAAKDLQGRTKYER